MFAKSSIQTKLEKEIEDQLDKLSHASDAADYSAIVDRIAKLHKLKSEEKTKLPSMDNVLIVSANVFGILWLTRYEKEHVLASKALGFVMRPR